MQGNFAAHTQRRNPTGLQSHPQCDSCQPHNTSPGCPGMRPGVPVLDCLETWFRAPTSPTNSLTTCRKQGFLSSATQQAEPMEAQEAQEAQRGGRGSQVVVRSGGMGGCRWRPPSGARIRANRWLGIPPRWNQQTTYHRSGTHPRTEGPNRGCEIAGWPGFLCTYFPVYCAPLHPRTRCCCPSALEGRPSGVCLPTQLVKPRIDTHFPPVGQQFSSPSLHWQFPGSRLSSQCY